MMESFKKMFPGKSSNEEDGDKKSGDAVSLLKEDHAKVKQLFSEFESSQNDNEKQDLLKKIIKELEIHTALEEKLVYPEMQDKMSDTIDEAFEEHHAVDLLLAELKKAGKRTGRLNAKVKVLEEMVKHHIQEEEGEMFPELEKSGKDMNELGAELMKMKQSLMKPAARKTAARKSTTGGIGKKSTALKGAAKTATKKATARKSAAKTTKKAKPAASKKSAAASRAAKSKKTAKVTKLASKSKGRAASASRGGRTTSARSRRSTASRRKKAS